jgi:hypothetical protein
MWNTTQTFKESSHNTCHFVFFLNYIPLSHGWTPMLFCWFHRLHEIKFLSLLGLREGLQVPARLIWSTREPPHTCQTHSLTLRRTIIIFIPLNCLHHKQTRHIFYTLSYYWGAANFKYRYCKGWFTHSMPCPCHAAKGLECVFPIWFTQCGRVWFTLGMPRPCHALTMPFFSRPRHSTAVERQPVGYLPAFGFFQLPCGVPRRLLSEAYQSSSQQSIPTTVKSGSNTLQEGRSVKPLD